MDFRALRPPGWLLQWHCGVRVSSNKKLVGFISAIPANIRIYDRYVLKLVRVGFDVLLFQNCSSNGLLKLLLQIVYGGGRGLRELFFLLSFAQPRTAQKDKVDLIKENWTVNNKKRAALCLCLSVSYMQTL